MHCDLENYQLKLKKQTKTPQDNPSVKAMRREISNISYIIEKLNYDINPITIQQSLAYEEEKRRFNQREYESFNRTAPNYKSGSEDPKYH